MNRRGFLTGLGAFIAAPAIVHVANIMPVKAISDKALLDQAYAELAADMTTTMYGDLVAVTRKAFAPRLFAQVWEESPMLSFMNDLRAEAA